MPFSVYTSKLAQAVNWARKFSLFEYPFVTPAVAWSSWRCGREIRHRALRAELPRFSPRQADLLIIVGTITERQGPVLRRIYDQMCEPKWASRSRVRIDRGFYQNYSAMPGADQVFQWTCTFPAARRGPSRCWMRWCCCRSGSRKARATARWCCGPSGATWRPTRPFGPTARPREGRAARPFASHGQDHPRPARQQFVAGEIIEAGSQHGNEWRAWHRPTGGRGAVLRDDPSTALNMFIDLTCVDRLGRTPRFDVVLHLYSVDKKHRVRLLAGVPEEDPCIDSLVTLWPGATGSNARPSISTACASRPP